MQIGFFGKAETAPIELATDRGADATANRGSDRTELTTPSVVGAAETTTVVPVAEAPTTAEVPTTVPVTAPALTAPPATKAPVAQPPVTTPPTTAVQSLRVEAATPAVATAPAEAPAAVPTVATDVWSRLAKCESGIRNDGGAPYYGYFQFSAATWKSVGGAGLPNDHSYAVQLEFAKKLQARSGWGQWPHCSKVALAG